MKPFFFLLIALTSVVVATFDWASEPRELRYYRTDAPKDGRQYQYIGKAHPQEYVTFHLGLPMRNLDELKRIAYDRGNPNSPRYAQWLSKEEIRELVGTDETIVRQVMLWLEDHVVSPHDVEQFAVLTDAIKVRATVEYIERLFNTEMHEWRSETGGTYIKHKYELTMPEVISQHVQIVSGITQFPPPGLKSIKQGTPGVHLPECNTPINMRALHNMTIDDVIPSGTEVKYAPFADVPGQDGWGVRDLAEFQEADEISPNPVHAVFGTGHNTTQYNDGEANLDVIMITGLGVGGHLDMFIMEEGTGWIYEYLLSFETYDNPPLVNSLSYAWEEDQECSNSTYPFLGLCEKENIPDSRAYVNLTDVQFLKLVTQGYTFFSAAGDNGVNGGHGNSNCKITHPLYPASSPYVVAVGSTVPVFNDSVPNLDNSTWTQTICDETSRDGCKCNTAPVSVATMPDNYGGFASGGGFNIWVDTPSYQQDAVSNYLNSGVVLPADGTYNPNGRGYPDVAATGGACSVFVGGLTLEAGTSCSCPQVAGIFATINGVLMAAGGKSVGFVHPALYSVGPDAYFDVTQGYNSGLCDGYGHGDDVGFHATKGWDPVSGNGLVQYGPMLDYLKNAQGLN